MSNPELWIALLVALGGGAFLREVGTGLWKLLTGRQDRERTALRQALRDFDAESALRRQWTECAHELRLIAIQAGVPRDQLPEFPSRSRNRD